MLRETFRSLAARGWRCLLTYHECGGLIPEYVRIGQSGREILQEQFGLSRYLDQTRRFGARNNAVMLSAAPIAALFRTTPLAHRPDGITVLGVQFASIKSLFAPLADHTKLMFVHLNDWLNELRYRFRPGDLLQVEPLAETDWREWRCPPGWANRFAPVIMPMLARRLRRAWRKQGWSNPRLVVTFPLLPAPRAEARAGADRLLCGRQLPGLLAGSGRRAPGAGRRTDQDRRCQHRRKFAACGLVPRARPFGVGKNSPGSQRRIA